MFEFDDSFSDERTLAWLRMDICGVGGVNGGYQVLSKLTDKLRAFARKIFCIQEERFSHRLLRTVITFIMIDFAWFFFRLRGMRDFIPVCKNIVTGFNPWIFFDGGLFQCGLERKNFYLLLSSIGALMVADYYKYRGVVIHKKILQQDFWFRWLVFAGGTLFILIFGIWGGNYDAKNFIYFQF